MAGVGEVVEALASLGGTSDTARLRALTSRRAVTRAVRMGRVLQPRLGTCALPVLDETEAAVRATGGVRSHLSAALHHGWPVATAPDLPMVTVPRTSRLGADRRAGVRVFWSTLDPDERSLRVTAPTRTVVDCARVLPYAEALAVADSALRSGAVTRETLLAAASCSPRTGRAKAVRVVRAADARAANPFESVLRGLAHAVVGLDLEPQVVVTSTDGSTIGRADLVDLALGIVVEAESRQFHAGREGFLKDVRRYTAMTRAGWRVVRFVWDDVMRDPSYVVDVLTDLVAIAAHGPTQTSD